MRRHVHAPLFFGALALALAASGCSNEQAPPKDEPRKTVEKVDAKTETTQVGTTLESKSEVKQQTPGGTSTVKTDTYVGTVTTFTAGKKIEVMTGEKKTHSVDLDDKDLVAAIDSGVTVGSRVRLIEEKNSASKITKVTVTNEK
ncbi:MAG TPA: hypothetical protein VGR00_15370 [Thermoanaerobaculia bacterium]|nr:hypothetical protein [Thermoanaerobaculia bacterium]